MYRTYVIFVGIIQLVFHLLSSHCSPGHLICCPIIIHVTLVFQIGKPIHGTWTILRHLLRLCASSIHLRMINTRVEPVEKTFNLHMLPIYGNYIQVNL